MAEKINLEIVTPDRLVFAGEVDFVTVPGSKGALGILPRHAPLLSELKTGAIRYSAGGQDNVLFCGRGFVEVLQERVSVLVEEAKKPSEINLEEARADQARAEQLLRSKDPNRDYDAALQLLESAVARIEVVGR